MGPRGRGASGRASVRDEVGVVVPGEALTSLPTSPREDALRIVAVCTGNVARSVMLGYMLTTLAESSGLPWRVRTAGTHVVENSAMSSRTKSALEALGELGEHRYGAHRSRQLSAEDVAGADLILAAEADHVRYVRRHFPDAASKTVSLGQLLGERSGHGGWRERVRRSTGEEPDPAYDVADPAGGDQEAYDACARALWSLAREFAAMLEVRD